MNVLFVCTAGQDRSVTAAHIFNGLDGRVIAKAAGTDSPIRQISQKLVDWADVVFVMEPKHKAYIADHLNCHESKLVVLNIPDEYEGGDPKLIAELWKKVPSYL